MKTTTATNTAWLITTIPIFIVILSYFFLSEKITASEASGMGIAAAGVLLLISRGNLSSFGFVRSYGDWLVLASCVTWAIYTILGRKLKDFHPITVTINILILATLILAPPVLLSSGITTYFSLPPKIGLTLLFLGVACMGIGLWFWSEGLSRKSAGQVGVYLYIEPLATVAVAPFVLGESITLWLIAGGLMTVLGVYLVDKKPSRLRIR